MGRGCPLISSPNASPWIARRRRCGPSGHRACCRRKDRLIEMPLDNEAALDDALTRSADGAMVIGDDERVVLWNHSAERLLGYGPGDVIGRTCYDVLAGCDEAGNRLCSRECHVLRLARRGDPVRTFDMRTRTKAGRQVWLNISTLVSHTPDGGCVVTHLFRDVTDKAASPRLPDDQ